MALYQLLLWDWFW